MRSSRPAARALRAPTRGAETWVVFDLGSRVCRAGLGGEAAPHVLLDATRLGQLAPPADALWDLDWQRAPHAQDARQRYALLVRCVAQVVQSVYQEHLLCEGHSHPVLVAHSPLGLEALRHAWCDVLLRHMHAPRVSFVDTHVLCTLAAGRTNALVVDIGYLETCVMPVYDGRPMTACLTTTPRAGKRLAQGLAALLYAYACQGQGPPPSRDLVEAIQTQHLVVGAPGIPGLGAAWPLDVDAFTRVYATHPTTASHVEVGGLRVPGWLRERACELLLEPGDEDEQSIGECVARSVRLLPRDMQRDMQASLLLAGGTAMLPGMAERLEADVAQALGAPPPTVSVLNHRTTFVPSMWRR
ncbi:hypothetical protein MNAN1_003954 [Malassezia nana]|uniref:Actin-related protein 10 n=1 Tax=Malassezia nana TaxID=180528 RepID=A0AAF0EQR5_9BASI|nr:hypothetical protein MNAN1_003954 [Malassezia nana]